LVKIPRLYLTRDVPAFFSESVEYDHRNDMRILVVHAWLRGNLGDVLQLSVLLSALRELRPRTLDLAGYPARPADETRELLALTDHYLADPFLWYWKLVPKSIGRVSIEPFWRAQRRALFSRYDAIVCAPGPYLADYDARARSALCDITMARELGLPVILSSHSIGPLQPDELAVVANATVRIAREPSTHEYLRQHGISSSLSADLAFLYPYSEIASRAPVEPPYRLIFLRSNNLDVTALRLQDGALFEGLRLIAAALNDRLVLATSDYRRDESVLSIAARRLGVPCVACRSVAELVQLIGASSGVVSDRYHPAICAVALGKPAQVLENREPHKMYGLKHLLADHTLNELQELAQAGLKTATDALRGGQTP
jgi:polysaccharide pyruvyl transferase WcaK-like protein